MEDALALLRGSLQAYLAIVAGLGLVTLAWALANIVLFDRVTLATAWFAVTGSGTILVSALLYWHLYVGDLERVIE